MFRKVELHRGDVYALAANGRVYKFSFADDGQPSIEYVAWNHVDAGEPLYTLDRRAK